MTGNKEIAVNSIIIFARLCIVSLVSIIASRIVLDALGASDYGLYNVVGGIVVVLNVFNTAMLSTTYRYIAFELGKGPNGTPNAVFNASFAIHACFAALIILLGATIGEFYINHYLNIAPEQLPDAKFIFRISVITTAFSTLLVPYQGLLIAFEKFSVAAIIDIVAQLVKLGVIILLLYAAKNRVRTYSIIMLVYNILACSLFLMYCSWHYIHIIKLRFCRDVKLYKEMLSFSFWTLFGACASVGKIQGSAIIINYFFGTIVNAAFAVANQVENFILMFARSLNNAAIPQITKNFSGGNSDRSIKLASYISKYTYFLMLLVAFPVILEMDFLLDLWLKNVPEGATTFCQLMVLGGLLGCLGEGIPALVNATGKIKYYQIVTHSFTLLGLPIAFVFYKFGYESYTILVIFCVISALSAILRLYLLKRIFNFDIMIFIRTSYLKMLYVSIPLILVYLFYDPSHFSIWGHVAGLFITDFFLIVVLFVIGTDKQERCIMKNIISNYKEGKRGLCVKNR